MITQIRGGMNVKRFHTTERIREETVGHHSANVCALLLRLRPDVSRSLLVHALFHDVAEVYTGDVPYPFKKDHPEAAELLKAGEVEYEEQYLHDLLCPIDADELKLFKLADMLDLVLSSIEEVGRGNVYAKQLIVNGQDYIQGMGWSDEVMAQCESIVWEAKEKWVPTTSK